MNVAVLGTGIIGSALAKRLLSFNHRVIVYNRTAAKAAGLESLGCGIAQTANSAISQAEAIILALADTKAVENVLFAEESDFADKTFIQMGTIAPEESIEFQKKIYLKGGHYLECPVLGSKKEALSGTLILMVGSTEERFAKWEGFLKCFGPAPRLIGEVGKAAALKLALNQLIASHAVGFSLSLGLVEKNNIDTNEFMNILRESALFAPMFEKKLANWTGRNYENANFPVKLLLKDVKLVVREAKARGLNITAAQAIQKILEDTNKAGYEDKDYSAVFNIINNI